MRRFAAILLGTTLLAVSPRAFAGTKSIDESAWKRTGGVPTSLPGVYVERNQILFHNAARYYQLKRFEYTPDEQGRAIDRDFFGRYSTWERLLYFGYGLTNGLAVEMEATVVSDAVLETSPQDTGSRRRIRESGLGDMETRLNWQWLREEESRPGVFSYGEIGYPLQPGNRIIGSSEWEGKLGSGMMRSTRWGTVALRAAAKYESEEGAVEFGEVGLDYLKQVTPACRFLAGVERLPNEWEFVLVAQFHDFSPPRFPESP